MKIIIALACICAVVSAQGKGEYYPGLSTFANVYGNGGMQGDSLMRALKCVDGAVGTSGSGQFQNCAKSNRYDIVSYYDNLYKTNSKLTRVLILIFAAVLNLSLKNSMILQMPHLRLYTT